MSRHLLVAEQMTPHASNGCSAGPSGQDPRWWICTTSSNTAPSEEKVCPRRPDSLASGLGNLYRVERRDWVSCVFMHLYARFGLLLETGLTG